MGFPLWNNGFGNTPVSAFYVWIPGEYYRPQTAGKVRTLTQTLLKSLRLFADWPPNLVVPL
jgi:hypothetical protein